jgi:hypothetical protein
MYLTATLSPTGSLIKLSLPISLTGNLTKLSPIPNYFTMMPVSMSFIILPYSASIPFDSHGPRSYGFCAELGEGKCAQIGIGNNELMADILSAPRAGGPIVSRLRSGKVALSVRTVHLKCQSDVVSNRMGIQDGLLK